MRASVVVGALSLGPSLVAAQSNAVADFVASGLGLTNAAEKTGAGDVASRTTTGILTLATSVVDALVEGKGTATEDADGSAMSSTRAARSSTSRSGSVSSSSSTSSTSSMSSTSSTSSISSSSSSSTKHSSTGHPSSSSTGSPPLSISSGLPHGNVSVDECWSSWEAFWTWKHDKTEIHSSVVSVVTSTTVETVGRDETTVGTWTGSLDTTRTIDNGGFAISTQTIHSTWTSTDIYEAIPTSTSTDVYSYTSYSTWKEKPTNTITKPACMLPTYVPQCQSQWEAWIQTRLETPAPEPPTHCDVGAGFLNGRPVPECASSYSTVQESYYSWDQSQSDLQPSCTQASISGTQCQSIRDDYVQMKASVFAPKAYTTAFFFSAGYLGMFQNVSAGDMEPSYYWPTSATLRPAPSCTLGCGRCAVTGGTVDVLYWPTPTATGGPAPTTPVTLETLGTTLTSPTVYISYSNLYASNGCSGLGTTISSTIVPIPTDQTLSSVYAGTVACDAHFRMTQVWTASASFNLADLQAGSSVPYSIYSSQPWCQSYLRDQGCTGTCPTDTPYKPIVVVPQDVLRDLQPEWSECFGDIRGAYDPPKALKPLASADGPEAPEPTGDGGDSAPEPTPATPADGPEGPTPAPTGGAADPGPTLDPVAQPDNDPSLTEGGDSGDGAGGNGQDQPTPTQNVGGIIGSLLGPPGGNDASPTTAQNPGGIIGSLIGGNADPATGGAADPQPTENAGAASSNGEVPTGGDEAGSGDPANGSGQPAPVEGSQPANDPNPPAQGGSGSQDPVSGGQDTSGGSGQPSSGTGSQGDSSGNADPNTASGQPSSADEPPRPGSGSTSNTDPQDASPGPQDPATGPDAPPPSAIPITIGSDTVTAAPAQASDGSPAVEIVNAGQTTTLAAGDEAANIGGSQVSVGLEGDIVYGDGSGGGEQTTVAVPSAGDAAAAPSTVAAIGSGSVTVAPASGSSGGAAVIAYDGTTVTVAPGESVEVAGEEVSMASDGGLVYGAGSEATTLAVPTATATATDEGGVAQQTDNAAVAVVASARWLGGLVVPAAAAAVWL